MTNKHPEALASAYRRAVAKSSKIKELGISPDMTDEELDSTIELVAKAKADRDGVEWTTLVKGQRWYINDLKDFSELTANERLELEYTNSFPDVASELEMLNQLEAMM